MKDERGRLGWSQQRLADELGWEDGRRQVVRLEAGAMPATLDLAEALAKAFGVPAFAFVNSVLPDQLTDETVGEANRWAGRELRARFHASLERPAVRRLAEALPALPDDSLERLADHVEAEVKFLYRAGRWGASAAEPLMEERQNRRQSRRHQTRPRHTGRGCAASKGNAGMLARSSAVAKWSTYCNPSPS